MFDEKAGGEGRGQNNKRPQKYYWIGPHKTLSMPLLVEVFWHNIAPAAKNEFWSIWKYFEILTAKCLQNYLLEERFRFWEAILSVSDVGVFQHKIVSAAKNGFLR